MSFVRQVLAWVWPAKIAFKELEDLQLRLLRLLLWLFFALGAYLLVRSLSQPSPSMLPLLGLWTFIIASLVLLAGRPQWRRPVLTTLMLGCVAVVYQASRYWAQAAPPGLIYLTAFGIVTALLDDPRSGNLICALCLGMMLLIRHQFPALNPREEHLWVNGFSCAFFGQLVGVAFFNIFGRVQEQLNDQAERLHKAEEDRVVLTTSLMQGLRPRLSELERVVQSRQVPLAEIRQTSAAFAQELAQAGDLRRSLNQIDDREAAQADLTQLRRRFMVAMVWLGIFALVAAALRNLRAGNGDVSMPLAAAAGLLALLVWLRQRQVPVLLIDRTLLLLFLALFLVGIHEQGLQGVPPTLPYLPDLVLAAALLSGTGFALLFVGIGTTVIFWVWTQGSLAFPDKVMLQNLLAILVVLTVICHQVWELHRALMERLEARAAELAATMRLRRRLLGTLFHDISNPLMVIQGLLQLDAAGVPVQPEDRARIAHMSGRIRQIVDHVETFLLVETQVPDEKMQAVEVAQLFADTQDLFEARLRAKRQHLTFTSPPGLAVLGLPEVLRDSVLSNLVSNALKFSLTATGLALEAREQGGEIALVVRDTGPGVPADVIEALLRRQSVASREGSSGEQGQGLGLSLVQEHLQRLGGRLELQRLPGGGTEARAWLKKA